MFRIRKNAVSLTLGVLLIVSIGIFIAVDGDKASSAVENRLQAPHEVAVDQIPTSANIDKADSTNEFISTILDQTAKIDQVEESRPIQENDLVLEFADLSEFIDHVDALDKSTVKLEEIMDFIDGSKEAFEHIKTVFWTVDDPDIRKLVLYILDKSESADKFDIAAVLTDSDEPAERKIAYDWLTYSLPPEPYQLAETLTNAIEIETDTNLLVDLMSVTKARKSDIEVNDRIINRIKDLSYHQNEQVSTHALLTLTPLAKNQDTLDLLAWHIETSPPALQLASIHSLSHFDYPGEPVMQNLNLIVSDPTAPQDLREAAVNALVTFENYAANKE